MQRGSGSRFNRLLTWVLLVLNSSQALGSVCKKRQKLLGKAGYRLQSQAVAIVAGEKMQVFSRRLGTQLPDVLLEILVIDKQHIIGRLVHALQKTVPAIVQTVEHVRKIIISCRPDAVTRRRRQGKVFIFFRQYQGGLLFLQAKILRFGIKNFAVTAAGYYSWLAENGPQCPITRGCCRMSSSM